MAALIRGKLAPKRLMFHALVVVLFIVGAIVSGAVFDSGSKAQPVPMDPPAPSAYSLHTGIDCSDGNVLAIYAHPDDGILFMNPDLQEYLDRGDCVTVLQLTAGDAGTGDQASRNCPPAGIHTFYWVCRDLGEEAAFGEMAHLANSATGITTSAPEWANGYWQDPSTHQYLSEYWIAQDPKITILNVALPDGGTTGTGFTATANQSMWRLYTNQIPTMTSLDRIDANPNGYASWTRSQLQTLITNVYLAVSPNRINTQDATLPPNDPGGFSGPLSGGTAGPGSPVVTDHSDHIIGARIAFDAAFTPSVWGAKRWELVMYEGYPSAFNKTGFNGIGPDAYATWDSYKWDAVHAYVPYDPPIPCSTEISCEDGGESSLQLYAVVQREWTRGEWGFGLGY